MRSDIIEKQNKILLILTFPLLIASLYSFSGCSSAIEITSPLRKEKIVIDGSDEDWKNVPAYGEEDFKFSLQICSDSEYVYLCLSLYDRQTMMQVMGEGLTVWLDRNGGDDKTFGINYPLGRQGSEPPSMEGRGQTENPEAMKSLRQSNFMEMEILGPEENDRYRTPVTMGDGIEVKIASLPNGNTIYELAVPLKKSSKHSYAVDINSNAEIGLGIESGEMTSRREKKNGKPGEFPGSFGGKAPPPGGRREQGGEEPPPGGGRPGSFGAKKNLVKQWFVVKLSTLKSK